MEVNAFEKKERFKIEHWTWQAKRQIVRSTILNIDLYDGISQVSSKTDN